MSSPNINLQKIKTYAYIDRANLHKDIENLGWKLSYKKFRDFLTNRYGVKKAYYFIGGERCKARRHNTI
jgi:hypothetical protein